MPEEQSTKAFSPDTWSRLYHVNHALTRRHLAFSLLIRSPRSLANSRQTKIATLNRPVTIHVTALRIPRKNNINRSFIDCKSLCAAIAMRAGMG